jgi:hypothetical protein
MQSRRHLENCTEGNVNAVDQFGESLIHRVRARLALNHICSPAASPPSTDPRRSARVSPRHACASKRRLKETIHPIVTSTQAVGLAPEHAVRWVKQLVETDVKLEDAKTAHPLELNPLLSVSQIPPCPSVCACRCACTTREPDFVCFLVVLWVQLLDSLGGIRLRTLGSQGRGQVRHADHLPCHPSRAP